MNLNSIVAAAVGAVNPEVLLAIQVSTGATGNPDASRTPTFLPTCYRWGQLQPLQYNDILQIEGLNLQGIRKKVYINGAVDGLVRGRKMGGDLITTSPPNSEVWKVAMVTEAWPDWTSAIITLQDMIAAEFPWLT